tara:strand:+ start:30665 stop:31945 length:1281 start_codon:yes stop_codon:yes gene_type:complete
MPFISIKDNSHPYVVFDGNKGVVPWNSGELQEIGLCSQFMRITARGLHYPSYSSNHRWLWEEEAEAKGWNLKTCTPFPGALCQQTEASNISMLYLPTGVVDLPDDLSVWEASKAKQPDYVQDILNGKASCTHPTSGRKIKAGDDRYELSLCDILDNNLDLVYDGRNQRIMYRYDETSVAEYILISVLGIYLVSCIAENIRTIISSEQRTYSWHQQIVYTWMIIATFVLVAVDYGYKTTYNFLLFQYERDLYEILFAYVVVEFATFVLIPIIQFYMETTHFFQYEIWKGDDDDESTPDPVDHNHEGNAIRCISLLTAFLILMTVRIHYSFDNPYIWLLSAIFGIRSMHKFINRLIAPLEEWGDADIDMKRFHYLKLILHIFDFTVFIAIMEYAVVPSYNLKPEATSSVFLVLVIALLSSTNVAYHAA